MSATVQLVRMLVPLALVIAAATNGARARAMKEGLPCRAPQHPNGVGVCTTEYDKCDDKVRAEPQHFALDFKSCDYGRTKMVCCIDIGKHAEATATAAPAATVTVPAAPAVDGAAVLSEQAKWRAARQQKTCTAAGQGVGVGACTSDDVNACSRDRNVYVSAGVSGCEGSFLETGCCVAKTLALAAADNSIRQLQAGARAAQDAVDVRSSALAAERNAAAASRMARCVQCVRNERGCVAKLDAARDTLASAVIIERKGYCAADTRRCYGQWQCSADEQTEAARVVSAEEQAAQPVLTAEQRAAAQAAAAARKASAEANAKWLYEHRDKAAEQLHIAEERARTAANNKAYAIAQAKAAEPKMSAMADANAVTQIIGNHLRATDAAAAAAAARARFLSANATPKPRTRRTNRVLTRLRRGRAAERQ